MDVSARVQEPLLKIGVRPDWESLVLQRGHEEFVLEKLDDRFTARSVANISLDDLAQQVQATIVPHPDLALVEFRVEAGHLEQAMQSVRSSNAIVFASHVYRMPSDVDRPLYLSNQLTLQFAPAVSAERMKAIAAAVGLQVLKLVPGVPKAFVFQLTHRAVANPIKLANRLMRYPEIVLAEPNIMVVPLAVESSHQPPAPNPPNLPPDLEESEEQAQNMPLRAARRLTHGLRSIVVAVADDGVDLTQPDFQGRDKVIAPKSFADDHHLPLSSPTSRGTAIARTAVAENGGIAPGCALMPIRLSGVIDDQAIEQLFEWVMTKGAAVVCCDWHIGGLPLSLRQRVAIARAATQGRSGKGCVIIVAAGLLSSAASVLTQVPRLSGLALHPDVLAVASATSDTAGATVTVAQDDIDGYGGSAGAIVCGIAALMLSVHPGLAASEVRQILQDTAAKDIQQAEPIDYSSIGYSRIGYGTVDLVAAVQAAQMRRAAGKLPHRWIEQQNTVLIDIPDCDAQGATSVILVEDNSPVRDIEISLEVEHDFMGDLDIYLIPPAGTALLLQNRSLGRITTLKKTYTPFTTPALHGALQQPAAGQWQLKLVDRAMLNTGYLRQWWLRLGI